MLYSALFYSALLLLLFKQDSSVLLRLVSNCWFWQLKTIVTCKAMSLWSVLVKSCPLTPEDSVGDSEERGEKILTVFLSHTGEDIFLEMQLGSFFFLSVFRRLSEVPVCVCVGPLVWELSKTSQNFQFLPYRVNTLHSFPMWNEPQGRKSDLARKSLHALSKSCKGIF